MKKHRHVLMYILAIASMALSNGKYLYAPAAFVFPLLFLMSFKKETFKRSSLMLVLGLAIGNAISFHGMLPDVGMKYLHALPFLAGALMAPAFIAQMYAFKKSKSYSMVLILPSLYTLMDFLNSKFNPFGGFGLLGYSQHNFLALVQWASVFGAIGLTFLIMLFGSATFWLVKENKFTYPNKHLVIYASIIVAVLGFGMVRLYTPNVSDTFKVSGLHTLDRTVDETADLFSDYADNPNKFIEASNANLDKVLTLTINEAQSGADVVNHAEATIVLSHKNKELGIEKIKHTARDQGIVIVTTIYVLNPPPEKNENVLLIIDETGQVVVRHYKYGGNEFEGSVKGNRVIESVETTHGHIAGIICWDKDFPSTVAQVGRRNTDTLFIPSADWEAISPYHAIVGTFRGLENGANVVTQTVNGMSMIVDYKGRVISEMDHFQNKTWINRGDLPVHTASTIYPHIEPYLGYVLIILLGYALFKLKVSKDNEGVI